MTCPKCGSENVNVQTVTHSELKNEHHGIIWWIFVGWWWVFVKWLIFTIPALIVAIFGHKKKKIKNTAVSMFVCQSCGYSWETGQKVKINK